MNDPIIIDCGYGPPHMHEYPSDWQFGGADGTDPRQDPRFKPNAYEYLDSAGRSVHITQVPICDDQALHEFTNVASWGLRPVYVAKYLPGTRKPIPMPWKYVEEEDTVYPL